MVEVEQRPLCALEQDVVTAAEGVLDEPRRVGEVALEAAAPARRELDERLDLEALLAADRRQQTVSVRDDGAQLGSQDLGIQQVLHPQPDPPGPVGVGRSDAAVGRAEGLVPQSCLEGPVERQMVGQDHVRAPAHAHRRGVDSACGERVELPDQRVRVDHHARSDHAADVRIEHARGHEVQLEHLVARLDRVAGVVAALVAHDHGDLLGQEVRCLALALVAPLQADDHGRRHVQASSGATKRPRPAGRGPGYTPPLCRRRGACVLSKVLVRLTGRTGRLPGPIGRSSLAGAWGRPGV